MFIIIFVFQVAALEDPEILIHTQKDWQKTDSVSNTHGMNMRNPTMPKSDCEHAWVCSSVSECAVYK